MNSAGYQETVSGKVGLLHGFRAACSANLIPANGLLNAPNQTNCVCAYPNRTSLALVPIPNLETLLNN